jgi:hypothetical protein
MPPRAWWRRNGARRAGKPARSRAADPTELRPAAHAPTIAGDSTRHPRVPTIVGGRKPPVRGPMIAGDPRHPRRVRDARMTAESAGHERRMPARNRDPNERHRADADGVGRPRLLAKARAAASRAPRNALARALRLPGSTSRARRAAPQRRSRSSHSKGAKCSASRAIARAKGYPPKWDSKTETQESSSSSPCQGRATDSGSAP